MRKKISPMDSKFNVRCKECSEIISVSLNEGIEPIGEMVPDSVGEFLYIICFSAICPKCGKQICILEKQLPKKVREFIEQHSLTQT
ncbi:MAG: hypothetical protein PHP54_04955 [Clostridia bacterium]|nr:hypothetical protein [Clostridia bacterium]